MLPAADHVRAERSADLDAGFAQQLAGLEEIARVQMAVDVIIHRMHRQPCGAPDPGDPEVWHRGQRDKIVPQVAKQRVQAGVLRRWEIVDARGHRRPCRIRGWSRRARRGNRLLRAYDAGGHEDGRQQ